MVMVIEWLYNTVWIFQDTSLQNLTREDLNMAKKRKL